MIFTINFLNLKINSESYSNFHSKIVEFCEDCLVHDCNTTNGFTIQLKSLDFNNKGRVEIKGDYNQSNSVIIEIEKEFQTSWSLNKMEELVKFLQDYDKSFK